MCIQELETGPGAHPDSCTLVLGLFAERKVTGALR